MTDLPMFPLELVAFPTEQLALHIFENRYRQLLEDCEVHNSTFGIPTYLGKKLKFGTEMRLLKVVKRYPDGSCDILCEGIKVFELVHFENSVPNKLYGMGEVRFLSNETTCCVNKNQELKTLFINFYKALEVEPPAPITSNFNSYTFAHKAGLTVEQEYELLQLTTEDDRLDYLIHYLKVMETTLSAVSRAKELIALNGHFKHFDPLDFMDI